MPLLFEESEYRAAPPADWIEVSLLGPGYGECAIIHIGDGKWIIVDSYVDRESTIAAPLRYLQDISAAPDGLYCAVASHWDDDHVRGMAQILEQYPNARFVTASAFAQKDFLKFAIAYSQPRTERHSSGVGEILRAIKLRGASIDWATNAKSILGPDHLSFSHGHAVSIVSLSPSNQETSDFLSWVASEFPSRLETRRAAPSRRRNHFSVVLQVQVGDVSLLLGADLEEVGQPTRGWSAVLADPGRPSNRSELFKVPHHGSENAHFGGVWSDMLNEQPIAMLAPFRRGKSNLPTQNDVQRILSFTTEAYATNGLSKQRTLKRSKAVEKTIKDSGVLVRAIPNQPGMVRARRTINGTGPWTVELFGAARHLSEVEADSRA